MLDMELNLETGFSELSETELMDCEGGFFATTPTWWNYFKVLGGSFAAGYAVGYALA